MTKSPSEQTFSSRRRFKKLVSFWLILLLAMVALLATVAFLQYRWTDEASAAAEMRIGAELESLMMKWHADLYGEFSAICTAMQVGPDSGARDAWDDYLERYVEWKNAPPHETLPNVYRNPDLVQDVYIWDTNLDSKPQLSRLSAKAKKIEPVEIPQNLQTLLIRLRANSTSLSTSLRVWELPGQPSQRGSFDANPTPHSQEISTGWQFDETVPAIVHPIFQRDGRSLSSLSPVDWMVVVLDRNALQKRILPELAGRYFGGQEGLEYRVAVVTKGANPRIVYSSDEGFGTGDVAAADASLNIFGHQPETAQDPSQQPVNNIHALRSTEWHSFYGSAWFPVIRYEPQPSPWVLVVQRRADPLRDLIRRVRQKNLAVSAFLLLLLAANMTLLTIAGIRAQEFNKLQMDFVASVSHELRTPLTTIFAAAENIKDGVIREKSDLEDYGSMLMGKSRQLMDHVDRIMLFASVRSGKVRYNIRHLRVAEILQRVRSGLANLLIEQGFVIEESLDPDLPCVLGDQLAVCSCLENLITNAIKYGGGDRRIRIRASLRHGEGGAKVAISVQDNGMGIHSSELKRIFEPFYRTPEATQAHIPGTGLGLFVSKHSAEAMGGGISVQSDVGVGSIFTLHLLAVDSRDEELVEVGSQNKVPGHE